jgi:two-component system, NtrC family, sensor kinase
MATTRPMPATDRDRVDALQKYAILDTEPEQAFDDLTMLASFICKTPIALISLVDEDRQWFKSKVGMIATQSPRDMAFCSVAIQQSEVMVVPDTLKDERFCTNPFVTGGPKIRFYAGAPLINEDGYALGTLCVIDQTPREFGADQKEALQALSRLVLAQLEFRKNLRLLKEVLTDRTEAEHERERELLKLQQTLTRVLGLRIV